jgi:hypothetical protein
MNSALGPDRSLQAEGQNAWESGHKGGIYPKTVDLYYSNILPKPTI